MWSTTLLWCIPYYFLAIIMMYLFAIKLQWFPISGYTDWRSLVLPVATMVVYGLTAGLRVTRSEALEVISERFVRTAYAKGLSKRKVLIRHVLRNALIPLIVGFFIGIPSLIGGSIMIESIFALPGMGSLVVNSIFSKDFPFIQAYFLIISVLTVTCNLLGDLMVAAVNPRVKVSMKEG